MFVDNVAQMQKWSSLTTSNWREVSVYGDDGLPLSVGASIDDAEVQTEVPGCSLDEDVIGPGPRSRWLLHVIPVLSPAPLLQTFPMHVELARFKVDPQVLNFLGVDVCLDELLYTFFQVHEVGDCHPSALEEEHHWVPPALLDNSVRETAPVPKCGFIQLQTFTSFVDCHGENFCICSTCTPLQIADNHSSHAFNSRFLILTTVCQMRRFTATALSERRGCWRGWN